MKLTSVLPHSILALAISSSAVSAQDIVIGTPNWPSVQAVGNILKVVIEDNLGLDVEIQNGTNPIIFEAMSTGSMHIHPEVWMPNQQELHDKYLVENATVKRGGGDGVPASTAICVNTSFAAANGITSVDDLSDPSIAPLFDSDGDGKGEMWIGATGWASTNIERIRAKSYGFSETLDLIELDETVAFSNIATAENAGKGWVGACYAPHYIFSLYDLTLLDEPEHDPEQWQITQPTDNPDWLEVSSAPVHWPSSYLYPYYSIELEENFPEVSALLNAVRLDQDSVGAMTHAIVVEKQSPEDFAAKWVADNAGLVSDWLSK